MKKLIDFLIIFFFSVNIFLVLISNQTISVNSSFVVILMILIIGIVREIKFNQIRINLFLYLFGYFFMFLAPLMQLSYGRLPNLINFNSLLILKSNVLIILFYMTFLIFDIILSTRSKFDLYDNFELVYSNKIRNIYFLAAIIFSFISFSIFRWEYFITRYTYSEIITNSSLFLIFFSATKGMVTAGFIMEFLHFQKFRNNLFRVISISILFIYNVNPFNVSRYYISYVLILICLIFFNKKIKVNNMIIILIVGIIFVFPLLNFYRNGIAQINLNEYFDLVGTQFLSLHFDSYSQLVADLKYVEYYGYSYGLQFLSVLLFFVPRIFFPLKYEGSGALIGQFLNQYTDFFYIAAGFSNVSNPLIGEIYLNFGTIGVVIMPFLLIILFNFLNSKHYFVYLIVCSYSIFIMRGDLMSSFAYCVGTIIFLAVIPKLKYERRI